MSYKQKPFWGMTNFTKIVITRPPDSNTQIPVRQLKRHKTRINVTLVVLGYLLKQHIDCATSMASCLAAYM